MEARKCCGKQEEIYNPRRDENTKKKKNAGIMEFDTKETI